jgi:trans-aconitate 2-methyltransferase
MTEWNAPGYARIATLQESMAAEVLGLLVLNGNDRVLDLGCGNGKVTAEIAIRLPQGFVVGIDASSQMVAFASANFIRPNLRFETCDIRALPFQKEFDLVVSFNALHWIPDQQTALRGIHSALKRNGKAQLRLVAQGPRKSLENVLEETCLSPRWVQYFKNFRDPYLHLTPEQYAELAGQNGLRVLSLETKDHAWDFKSREAFVAFGAVTFVEWTKFIPDTDHLAFIDDVLDRYRLVAAAHPSDVNVFRFYQMDIQLAAGFSAT